MSNMQNNIILLLLIVGHLLGDYYFQSDDLVTKKKNQCKFVIYHGLIYCACILLLLLPIFSIKVIVAFLIVSISHFLIDLVKMKINNYSKKNKFISWIKRNVFCLDQALHMAIIIIIAFYYAINYTIALNHIGKFILQTYNSFSSYSPIKVLSLTIILLIIGKPTNIIIREMNKKESAKEEGDEAKNDNVKAGRLIGILERMLIVILLIVGQYTAIGLVFAAKSLTRFDKISKDSKFAEYYLIGTLLSILIAIVTFLLFKGYLIAVK